MGRGRNDQWLLVRLAAQNLGRRRLRAISLGAAVMLACGVGLASFVCGWALMSGMTTSLSRMGADLVVVPRGTLVNITTSLLTVQPTDETLDAGLALALAATPGIAEVAPQRLLRMAVNGSEANVIAFDPTVDFSVLPWLDDHQAGGLPTPLLLAGARAAGRVGEVLVICGRPFTVYGRLGPTGVGPFDGSYFSTFDALAGLDSACHMSTGSASAPSAVSDGPRVSAFMLRLSAGAKAADVKFAIGQIPNIRIVEGNTISTSSRQALALLMIGIGIANVCQLTALLIVVSLLFTAIAQERYREVGLLRAMGARPDQIMSVMLVEAAIVTGLGGVAGLGFGAVLLSIFARSLGFDFELLGIPFAWPPLEVLVASAGGAVLLSAVIGLVGAFVPAWRVRRMDPHTLIQAEMT